MTHLWLPFLMQTRAWHAWLTVYYDLSNATRCWINGETFIYPPVAAYADKWV